MCGFFTIRRAASGFVWLAPEVIFSTSPALKTGSWSRVGIVKSSQVKFIYIAHFKTTVVDQSAVHKYNIKNKTKNKKA